MSFDPFADAYGPVDADRAVDRRPADPSPAERPPPGRRTPVSLSEIAARAATPAGIACPKCGCPEWRVTHTRPQEGFIRRRRVCDHCDHAISTSERRVG